MVPKYLGHPPTWVLGWVGCLWFLRTSDTLLHAQNEELSIVLRNHRHYCIPRVSIVLGLVVCLWFLRTLDGLVVYGS